MPPTLDNSLHYFQSHDQALLSEAENWIMLQRTSQAVSLGVVRATYAIERAPKRVTNGNLRIARPTNELTTHGAARTRTFEVRQSIATINEVLQAVETHARAKLGGREFGRTITGLLGSTHPAATAIGTLQNSIGIALERVHSRTFREQISISKEVGFSETITVPENENRRINVCPEYDEWEAALYLRHFDLLCVRVARNHKPECFPANDTAPRYWIRMFSPSSSERARNVFRVRKRIGVLRFLAPTGNYVTLFDDELSNRDLADPTRVSFHPRNGSMPGNAGVYSAPKSLYEIVRSRPFIRSAKELI